MKKETYFDILHSTITIVIAAVLLFIFKLDMKSKAELIVLSTVIGFGIGGAVSFIWEAIIEEQIMKRPASQKDVINMMISGTVAGFAFSFFLLPLWLLIILSLAATGFVFYEIWKWYKTKR